MNSDERANSGVKLKSFNATVFWLHMSQYVLTLFYCSIFKDSVGRFFINQGYFGFV